MVDGKREKKNTSEVEKDISMFKKPDGPTIGRISSPVRSIKPFKYWTDIKPPEPAIGPMTQWNRTVPFCKHGRAPLGLMFWAKAHCWVLSYL